MTTQLFVENFLWPQVNAACTVRTSTSRQPLKIARLHRNERLTSVWPGSGILFLCISAHPPSKGCVLVTLTFIRYRSTLHVALIGLSGNFLLFEAFAWGSMTFLNSGFLTIVSHSRIHDAQHKFLLNWWKNCFIGLMLQLDRLRQSLLRMMSGPYETIQTKACLCPADD